jgi:hypothetical protein
VESLALIVMRVIEEEAIKDSTVEVRVELPVEVATYLINEKRTTLVNLEQRHRVNVVILPNQHLSTPHYHIERLKVEEGGVTRPLEASYTLKTKEIRVSERELPPEPKRPAHTVPVVKSLLPSTPPPPPAGQKAEPPSIIKRFLSNLFGGTEENEIVSAQKPKKPALMHQQNRNAPSSDTGQPDRRQASYRKPQAGSGSRPQQRDSRNQSERHPDPRKRRPQTPRQTGPSHAINPSHGHGQSQYPRPQMRAQSGRPAASERVPPGPGAQPTPEPVQVTSHGRRPQPTHGARTQQPTDNFSAYSHQNKPDYQTSAHQSVSPEFGSEHDAEQAGNVTATPGATQHTGSHGGHLRRGARRQHAGPNQPGAAQGPQDQLSPSHSKLAPSFTTDTAAEFYSASHPVQNVSIQSSERERSERERSAPIKHQRFEQQDSQEDLIIQISRPQRTSSPERTQKSEKLSFSVESASQSSPDVTNRQSERRTGTDRRLEDSNDERSTFGPFQAVQPQSAQITHAEKTSEQDKPVHLEKPVLVGHHQHDRRVIDDRRQAQTDQRHKVKFQFEVEPAVPAAQAPDAPAMPATPTAHSDNKNNEDNEDE